MHTICTQLPELEKPVTLGMAPVTITIKLRIVWVVIVSCTQWLVVKTVYYFTYTLSPVFSASW